MSSRIELDDSKYINYEIIGNCILIKNEGSTSGSRRGSLGMISEIEAVEEENEGTKLSFEVNTCGGPLETIKEEGTETSSGLFSFKIGSICDEIVHVGIIEKNEEASMDALFWALTHFVNPISTVVCLVYIFPRVNKIHTLLRKMAIDQANPQQKEIHLAYEEFKKAQFLTKFRNVCAAFEVNIDTVSVESNMEEKALLKLIPMLPIRKLVVGITRRSIIRSSKKGGGAAGLILRGAPEQCEVKIICEGKEVGDEILGVNHLHHHRHDEASEQESTSTATPEGFNQFRHHMELRQASFNNNTNKCNNPLSFVSCFKPKTTH